MFWRVLMVFLHLLLDITDEWRNHISWIGFFPSISNKASCHKPRRILVKHIMGWNLHIVVEGRISVNNFFIKIEKKMERIKEILKCFFFCHSNLDRDIETSSKRWKKFVESDCPEKEKFPQEWKNKTALQRLCMMRALRWIKIYFDFTKIKSNE